MPSTVSPPCRPTRPGTTQPSSEKVLNGKLFETPLVSRVCVCTVFIYFIIRIEKGLLGGASCWQAKILLSPPAGVQFSRQYYCTFYTVSVADHSMVGTVPLVLAPDHGIPPVSVPGYMRAQRRGDDCRRPRTTTRPPCPPGKAGCAPKAPPTAALLAKLLPRLTHGTPVQLIPQSAADRSSGRALRAARTRGHREAGQPG